MVMGILNMTPDSFYTGHLDKSTDEIIGVVAQMIEDGADIIDIGGQTTKPGSRRLSADEELKRIIPVIEQIQLKFPSTILSVDTFESKVAKVSVDAGVSIINDISSGEMDLKMYETVAELQVPYICMHMQGTPETMQQNPVYEDAVKDILDYFIKKINVLQKAGIKDIIIDPGFGFGKTVEHNFKLLKELNLFNILQKPILAGISRKSFIYKTLQLTPDHSLNGTTVLNTLALQKGASFLRVHDVKEATQAVRLFQAYQSA
jgi:dihydropteroate synthase